MTLRRRTRCLLRRAFHDHRYPLGKGFNQLVLRLYHYAAFPINEPPQAFYLNASQTFPKTKSLFKLRVYYDFACLINESPSLIYQPNGSETVRVTSDTLILACIDDYLSRPVNIRILIWRESPDIFCRNYVSHMKARQYVAGSCDVKGWGSPGSIRVRFSYSRGDPKSSSRIGAYRCEPGPTDPGP